MKKLLAPTFLLIAYMLLYHFVNTILVVFGVAISSDTLDSISGNTVIITLILTQLIVFIFVYLMHRGYNFKRYMRINKLSKKETLFALLGGIGILPLSTLIILGLNALIPDVVKNYTEMMEAMTLDANVILTLISIALLAPVVEEVLLRGLLFRQYEKVGAKAITIVILSGVLFGVFHLNIVQGIFTTVGGIFFALGFLWSRSLWVPILMHLANNLLSLSIGYLPETIQESTGLNIGLIALIVLLPLSMLYFYKHRKEDENLNEKL